MTDNPPSDNARRMGRPPLNAKAPTVKTTVRLDQKTIDRIGRLVGQQGMADFIRRATMEKLNREEAEAQVAWESSER